MQWFIFVWEWVNIYIYTPLCKQGRKRRQPCTCAIHLQPGRGGVSPLCSDCCTRLLRDWPPVSAFGRERGSRQHPLLVEHSRPNCRVIRAFESPNTTKVSKNTSKSRWICRFWQKKKSPGGWFVCVIISAWSGGKRWRYSLCIGKSLHFYSEKQNLEILLLQQFIVIYLLTTNVFKHVCVCVAACVHVFHKN